MKSIKLPGGSLVIVDDGNYEHLVGNYHWWLHKDLSHPIGYAQGCLRGKARSPKVYMHRVIMSLEGNSIDGKLVDHKDLNTLDNRASNLRLASHSESQHNKGLQRNNRSGYKGVSWWAQRNIWVVQLNRGRRKFARCYFRDLLQAAQASMLLRYLAHGDFANLD